LRLSNDERKALLVIDRAMTKALGPIDERRARRLVYERGAGACRRLAVGLVAIAPDRRGEATTLLAAATGWQPPRLPIAGADLLALGIEPGPRVGAILKELEAWWVAEDFPDATATRARLDALLASGLR
jgi:poly(A) polymerase